MADRTAVLEAQRLTESDVRRNRGGRLTEQQRIDLLGNEAAGAMILGGLALALAVGIPLLFARDDAMVWEISIGINAAWAAPILILQALFRRRITKGRVIAIEGTVDGITVWRGWPLLVIDGKSYPIRQRIGELFAAGDRVRVFAIPGVRNLVAIEPW